MSSQTEIEQKAASVDALNKFLSVYTAAKKDADSRAAFMAASALVTIAQKTLDVSVEHRAAICKALSEVFASLSKLRWSDVDFPISSTLLSQMYANIFTEHNVRDEDKHSVLLESLFTFVEIMQENVEYAKESILRGIVTDSVQTRTTAATAPELNYRANILKLFSPNTVSAIDLEPLQVIIYRGELLGGGFGPELWGLAYVIDEKAHVLLETGEYIYVPARSLTLAFTKDYDTSELPPYLMACAKIFMPALFGLVHGSELPVELAQKLETLDKHFGSFSSTIPSIKFGIAPLDDFSACENVIDRARWASNDTTAGAMKTMDIPNSDLRVIVTAQSAAIRPYITSTLVQASTGTILMRLDTPREFTARGIYLFPFNGQLTSLLVV